MRIASLVLAAFMVGVCAPARPDDTDISKEFLSQFQAIVQAMPSGDVAPIAKAVAKDFQFTDIIGRPGPAGQWADRSKSLLAAIKEPALTAEAKSTSVKGDSAQAFLRAKITGTGLDRQGQEGPLNMSVLYRTEWAKEGAAWKLKSVREVLFEGNVNKRPLNLSRSAADEEVRKQFVPLYGAIADLYEKQDWPAMEKGMPDGFIVHDAEGALLSKKELIDRVKAGAKAVTNPLMTIEAQQASLDGDKVTVIRVMKLFGDVALPGGKTGRVTYMQVTRDMFTKAEKTWAAKSSDELYAEATLNGQPIPLSVISGR